MKKIKLFNRDGADLYLEYVKEISPKVSLWELIVDDDHKYCLEYMRVIAKDYTSKDIADWNIEAIDPSGGPFLSLGDKVSEHHKIIQFINSSTLLLSEGNSD